MPNKRKHPETFAHEFLQLCKRHRLITESTKTSHVLQNEKETSRSRDWAMQVFLRHSFIRVQINNSLVFETHLPPPLNELVFTKRMLSVENWNYSSQNFH
jgi:hypothetical protein